MQRQKRGEVPIVNRTINKKETEKSLFFSTSFPSLQDIIKTVFFKEKSSTGLILLVCDRKLRLLPKLKAWLKGHFVYFVSAGEKLKSVENFPQHIQSILHQSSSQDIAGFISIGGGSVGDWTGFLASVYKRGRPLVHIPTTWLSAMDSAHGGKTALNAGQVKNILGTYCFPKAVFIVKEILPTPQFMPAEMLKIALIEGGDFYQHLLYADSQDQVSKNLLWKFLPQAVSAKVKIVRQDPYERHGKRVLLNLGHTMGHALELYFGLSHEKAVSYGLYFTLKWSDRCFHLSSSFLNEMSSCLATAKDLSTLLQKMPLRTLQSLLKQDKKRQGVEDMDFIFMKGPGQVFSKKVLIQDVLSEVRRQRA